MAVLRELRAHLGRLQDPHHLLVVAVDDRQPGQRDAGARQPDLAADERQNIRDIVAGICKTLGIQVNAAKHTIFRAVRKLRESLEPLVRSTPCNT